MPSLSTPHEPSRGNRLGGPGRAGLAITGQSFAAEDPPDIVRAGALATAELRDAIEQAEIGLVLADGWVNGVEVAVKADVVAVEGLDDIGSVAAVRARGLFRRPI